jgi:hypothetical protein
MVMRGRTPTIRLLSLLLLWIGMTVSSCATTRSQVAPAAQNAQRTGSATGTAPDVRVHQFDANAAVSGENNGVRSTEHSETAPAPDAGADLSDSVAPFRLFSEWHGAVGGAVRFSLDLPLDLWEVVDRPLADVADQAGSAFGLVLVWRPPDRPVPNLFPYDLRPRSWRELTTWEQIGVVVQTASAIAGAIYLLDRYLF